MLLIAGFAKCGTTSLFSYLAQHPDICGYASEIAALCRPGLLEPTRPEQA
jgi:hypothetical protein